MMEYYCLYVNCQSHLIVSCLALISRVGAALQHEQMLARTRGIINNYIIDSCHRSVLSLLQFMHKEDVS
jgi:hypothetical protein